MKIYRHDQTVLINGVSKTVKNECEGLGQLLGYREMYYKIKQIHGIKATKGQAYAALTDVD